MAVVAPTPNAKAAAAASASAAASANATAKDRQKTKNVAGPPVYYPPGVELFARKEEAMMQVSVLYFTDSYFIYLFITHSIFYRL